MSSTASIAKSSFLVSRIMSPEPPPRNSGSCCHDFHPGTGSAQAVSTPVEPNLPL
jgi:hypothetical protein